MSKLEHFNPIFGTFNDEESEQRFKVYALPIIKKIIYVVLLLFTFNVLVLIVVQLISPREEYSSAFLILVTRIVSLIYGVLILIYYRKIEDFNRFTTLIFYYLILLGVVNFIIHFSYPEPAKIKYAFEIMIIFSFYLVFPIGLRLQTIAALFFSASMSISLNSDVLSEMTFVFAIGMMVNCNVIGFIASRFYQKSIRKTFLVFQNETELKEKYEHSMATLKSISGLIPICKTCKSVQNVDGIWDRLEKFISNNSEIKLTHSICPECSQQLMSDFRHDE